MKGITKQISNWGNYPKLMTDEYFFIHQDEAKTIIEDNEEQIARGLGRCYGDASLSGNTISTAKFNKFLAFDISKGVLRCESGVSLEAILEVIMPKGWFLPVTPGTKYITIGGAVACDVHGKNHHKEGSFCEHIIEFDLLCSDGHVYTCNKHKNTGLFYTTCGGMGLTGIILRISFNLKRIETAYINQITKPARNLDEIFELFEQYKDYTYSMSWIDCYKTGKKLGRSVLFAGEHAEIDQLDRKIARNPLIISHKQKTKIPFYLPAFFMNRFSIRVFNFIYYLKNRSEKVRIVDYDSFFYPLDALLEWNKMYGKPGFVQYQFVLPLESSKDGLTQILRLINDNNKGSFLAVLKLFGKQNDLISFPMEGYTLALDFPITKSLFPFLDMLDEIVLSFGGRLYLTKDARMKPSMFKQSYPNAKEFIEIVKKYNPDYKFSSLQSKRLEIT